MSRLFALLLVGLAISGCSKATEADRAALMGLWKPEDGTTHTVEFKADGDFDYRYFAILRLSWALGRKGQVTLTSANGVALTCYYKIENDRLLIDNGSGDTCVTPSATPPEPMPKSFTRVK